jgi:hypothetical protein
MKGITVVCSAESCARPMAATTPFVFMVLSIQASTAPPRLSTAPVHVARPSGLIADTSRVARSRMSLAPSPVRYSRAAGVPVSAVTA